MKMLAGGLALGLALGVTTVAAQSNIAPGGSLNGLSVLGTDSIYQVFGHSGNPGGDYGPDTSAIEIDFASGAANVFTFTASGQVSCCSDAPNIPADGGTSSMSVAGANGLSSLAGNSNIPLVGVFTSNQDPFGNAAPAALTFDANSPASLAPQLNQVFYIGDGHGGRNNLAGSFLDFTAPTGATRLYIGAIDSFSFNGLTGYYNDNKGSFSVNVNLAAVPEPGTAALALTGLVVIFLVVGRRSQA